MLWKSFVIRSMVRMWKEISHPLCEKILSRRSLSSALSSYHKQLKQEKWEEKEKNLLFFPLEFIIQCPGHICIVSYCSDKRRDLKFCFRFYVILFIIRKKIITTVFMHLLSFLYSLIAIQYLIPKPLVLDEKFLLAKCFKFRFLSWFRLSSHLHENQ